MAHPFMAAVADGLAERNVATLRYQFPYIEEGSKRPDVPKVAHATVRAAVGEALRLLPGLAVVAGGEGFSMALGPIHWPRRVRACRQLSSDWLRLGVAPYAR